MKKNYFFYILFFAIFIFLALKRKQVSSFVMEKIGGINNGFDDIFLKTAQKLNINPKYLKAISANESNVGLDKRVEKIGDTKGLMHVIFDTAKRFDSTITQGQHKNLTPEKDIEIGSRYFSFLVKKYGNIEHAVKAYNGGEGRMNQILKYRTTGKFSPIKTGDNVEKMLKAENNMNTYYDRFNRNLKRIG